MGWNTRKSHIAVIPVGTMIGAQAAEVPLFEAPTRMNLQKITLFCDDITKSASNYADATVKNKGTTGSGTTSVATRGTDSTAISSCVGWDLTLTASEQTIEAGECLSFTWAETAGTAPTNLVNGKVQVEFIAPHTQNSG